MRTIGTEHSLIVAETHVHHQRFVDLLPQVRSEDLDKGDLECRNLAVHEDTRKVKLNLETNVDIGAIDRGRPPQCEATVRDLIET